MDNEIDHDARRAAIGWVIRLRHGEDQDWADFEEWLAENPDHAAAYQQIEDVDLDLDPLLADLDFQGAANDDDQIPTRRWWLAGGGTLAATIVLTLTFGSQFHRERYEVRTAPGETKVVALETGTKVTLNGGTTLVLDRKNPRFAELASGEALFEVRHDPARPFRVLVNGHLVEDAGTVFNLAYEDLELRLAVAEGKVLYEPGKRQRALAAGQTLAVSQGGRTLSIGTTRSEAVGGWRQGELSYQGEPLSKVASDLTRLLGLDVRVDQAIAARAYYGTIVLRRGDKAQLSAIMTALNVEAVRDRDGIIMRPPDNDRP